MTVHDSTASTVQVHMVKEDLVAADNALCQVSTAPEHATNLERGQVFAAESARNQEGFAEKLQAKKQ